MEKKMSSSIKFLKYLNYFEKVIGVLTGFMLISLVFYGVLARYILKVPAPFVEELSQLLYIWLVFSMAALLVSEDGYPRVEFFLRKIAKKGKLAESVSQLVVYILMFFFVIFEVYYLFNHFPPASQKTVYLHIPYRVVYGGAYVGFILMLVHLTFKITQVLSRIKKIKSRGEAL